MNLRHASNCCKRVLEAVRLAYANKTRESITSQKLSLRESCRFANSDLSKGKSVIPPLFNGPERLSSASDGAKLFDGNVSKNSNLEHSRVSLSAFPSETNLKLLNIPVTPKLVKKAITDLDLSKTAGPDCIFLWLF